jgi:DNA-directed RNA polymerase subunit RPC12/RpoP
MEKYTIYVCPKCKKQILEEFMGKRCPFCKEWQYYSKAEKEVAIIKKVKGNPNTQGR